MSGRRPSARFRRWRTKTPVVDAADRIRNGRAGADMWRGLPRGKSLMPSLAGLLLCACATYQPAPLDPAASVERFSSRRLDSEELHAQVSQLLPATATSPWPPAAWN